MKITSVDFGEIFAWLAAIVLTVVGVLDAQIFILFALLKLSIKIEFKV